MKNYRNISHRSEGCPISSEVPCFISKGGPCMKQVAVWSMFCIFIRRYALNTTYIKRKWSDAVSRRRSDFGLFHRLPGKPCNHVVLDLWHTGGVQEATEEWTYDKCCNHSRANSKWEVLLLHSVFIQWFSNCFWKCTDHCILWVVFLL